MRARAPRRPCRIAFPSCRDLSRFLQPIQGRIERAFFEFEQAAAADFEPAEDFEPVCLAALERGEDQHFQVAAELVAADWFHGQIIDRLGISGQAVIFGGFSSVLRGDSDDRLVCPLDQFG